MSAAEKPPDPPEYANGYADTCLAILDMMSRGYIIVHFDARRFDVDVPQFLKKGTAALHIGWGCYLKRPIDGLEVDSIGFRGLFSFGGKLSRVAVPWAAVFAAEGGGRQISWGERFPQGMPLQPAPSPARESLKKPAAHHRAPSPSTDAPKTHLKSVPLEVDAAPIAAPTGVLRIVRDDENPELS